QVELSPNALWPPDHRLVPVHAKVVATDACDPSPRWSLVSVTETDLGVTPEVPVPDANIQDVALGTADTDVMLRAERLGDGDGRMYTLCFEAADAAGNQTRACANVMVPHDQSGRATLVDTPSGGTLTLYGLNTGDLRQLDASSIVVRSGNTDVLVPAGDEAALSDVDHDGMTDAMIDMKSVPSAVVSGDALWGRWEAARPSS